MKERRQQAEGEAFGSEVSHRITIKALTVGANFYNKYNLQEVFDSDSEKQEEYFITCFARYYLLKTGREGERVLRDPRTEAMGRMPVIGRLIGFLSDLQHASDAAAQTLNLFAQAQEKDMVENHTQALEGVHPLGQEDIPSRFISPSQIEAAANFMTTALIESKTDKSKNLKQTIERIKNRYKAMES